jgi:molecular chaperone GrpE
MDENNQEQNIEKLQKDLDELTNNWKRTLADFDNFKKQKERENKELLEFAKEVTVVKLLPTLDTLGQALRHAPEMNQESPKEFAENSNPTGQAGIMNHEWGKKYENWLTGINGILIQLDKVLAELGVKKIQAIGKKFDPNFHEAVREVEGEEEDGIIIDELQSGFILNDKVIRPTQVVISKKKN